MTSAAFSIPDPQQPISQRPRRSRSPDTATSAAADAAIRQIIERRRKRHRYGLAEEPKPSIIGDAVDGLNGAVNDSIRQMGLPQWVLKVAFVALVAAVLGWAVFVRGAVSRHSVEGILLFEGHPLAQATLTFRRAGGPAEDDRVVQTDRLGAFRTEADAALPAGLYAVAVQPPHSVKKIVPPIYSDPTTTPLHVQVSEDLSGLKLLVRR